MQHAPLALCFALLSSLSWASNNKTNNGDLTVETPSITLSFTNKGQVERIAEVDLASGLSTVVFEGLNTAIDPAQIRLTGNGPFQVLSITHRYHTDTLSGASTADRRSEFQIERNELQKRINELNTQNIIFDREEQLLLNNQGFTVKDSGVDLERLIRASEFFRERFEAIQTGRLNLSKEIAQLQEAMYAIDRETNALPPLRTETRSKSSSTLKPPGPPKENSCSATG